MEQELELLQRQIDIEQQPVRDLVEQRHREVELGDVAARQPPWCSTHCSNAIEMVLRAAAARHRSPAERRAAICPSAYHRQRTRPRDRR